ncbi:hypothetical protein EON81_08885 [bacterium]|nr:MAG: hypothetical protein EON81_08885 [bacterium]
MRQVPFLLLCLTALAGCGTPTVLAPPTYEEQMAALKAGTKPGQPNDPNAIRKLIQSQDASNRLIQGMKQPGADPVALAKEYRDQVEKLKAKR